MSSPATVLQPSENSDPADLRRDRVATAGRPLLYVNGRFFAHRPTGVQRFAYEVIHALNGLLNEPENADYKGRVALVIPKGVTLPAGLENFQRIVGGMFGRGYAWEQFDLVRLSMGGVLLNLCNLAPVLKHRQVAVIHDAAPQAVPQAFSRAFRWAYGALIPMIARRTDRVVTVSAFSRDEIARWVGLPPSRFTVCHEGAEHILAVPSDRSVIDRNGLAGRGYFLAVGMGPANKNQSMLLRAFTQAGLENVSLVLTGRRSTRVHGSAALEVPQGVVHVGHVPDAELRALYEGALALVYPSTYEGFGLPPVEAMACGCPVVISDQPALLEVAAGAGHVVPMGDVDRLAGALREIAADQGLRDRLARNGLARAEQLTWRAAAERLLKQCRLAAA